MVFDRKKTQIRNGPNNVGTSIDFSGFLGWLCTSKYERAYVSQQIFRMDGEQSFMYFLQKKNSLLNTKPQPLTAWFSGEI